MVIVTVKYIVKPEKKADFVETFNKLKPLVIAEMGCKVYYLTRDLYRDNCFFLYEQWNSKMDLDMHLKTGHMKEYFEKTKDYFEQPPAIKQFAATEEKFTH